ncbi:hypothetical protein A2955_01245 [Candidatus Woesebacteria bacterium RIFCSPLOWO2_01_FULL_37_19]|uniref:Nudix hydrolase domain-containing protein n=1 Tax=Candidatus Woesebacteria bacterium RIFCSPLOWO2_01_FULL_37_19 TaxID=1802514 RepID=A0A1F8B6C0_9BACT|nr:MAG: hypothetical protein A2955_01245 [Candidatus Woesebacteria bacterium RIFCSPLOWO2_01_FULL_37_19]
MDNSKKSCVAIICHGDKILLFLRDNNPNITNPNKWQLPGGGPEDSESIYVTIRRELSEEVSFAPKNLKYLGWRIRRNGIIQYFFMYFAKNKEVPLFKLGNTEGQVIKFYTIKEMLKLDLVKYFRKFINRNRKALENALKSKKAPSSWQLGLRQG